MPCLSKVGGVADAEVEGDAWREWIMVDTGVSLTQEGSRFNIGGQANDGTSA